MDEKEIIESMEEMNPQRYAQAYMLKAIAYWLMRIVKDQKSVN